VFTQYFDWLNLPAENRRTRRALLVVDVFIGSALVVDAVMLARWPLTAVFTLALGILVALTALVLEPATARAALGDRDS
jgi:uncharacterized membrane protein YccC